MSVPLLFDYIALDSNALRGAGWPRLDADLENLLRSAKMFRVVICIPEPALLELEDFWSRTHQKRYEDAQGAIRKIEKIAETPQLLKQLVIRSSETLFADYQNETKGLIERFGIETVPITGRPVSAFFKMAARKEPPFRESGVGFKDSVIFFSIVDYFAGKAGGRSPGRVLVGLVTSDSDFVDEGLLSAARDAGVDLRIIPNIRAINDQFAATLQESARALVGRDKAEALRALEGARADIEKMLNSQLDISPSELSLGFPESLEIKGVQLLAIENVRTSYSLLSSTAQTRVKIAADIRVRIDLLVSRRVFPEESPIRTGQAWLPNLVTLARLANNKTETVNESVEKMALLEAVGEKTDSAYTSLQLLSVALPKKTFLYG